MNCHVVVEGHESSVRDNFENIIHMNCTDMLANISAFQENYYNDARFTNLRLLKATKLFVKHQSNRILIIQLSTLQLLQC